MSLRTVELKGQIVVGGSVCSDPCGDPASSKVQGLGLRCTATSFEAVQSTDAALDVVTPGSPGDAFVELPATDALDRIELLFVRANARVVLRIGAGEASVLGVGGAFVLGGGETLDLDVDGTAFTTTFPATATAQEVANQINAAAAIAGLAFQPASVDSGQLRISGDATGSGGSVTVVGGTAAAGLGLAGLSDVGDGEDVDVTGVFLAEFGRGSTTAPRRVQISGIARVEILAAGEAA